VLARTKQQTMTTAEKIKSASELVYDPEIDALYADGQLVGGASDMTRELMLELLDEELDDETMFDMIVSPV
jgi:D-serine dehydratase